MRQFRSDPVFVNDGTYWTGIVLDRQAGEFLRRDPKMVDWIDNTGKRIYEITPHPVQAGDPGGHRMKSKAKAEAYENSVLALLTTIARTEVGSLLLAGLNKRQKYWIVPLDDADRAQCNAKSGQYGHGCGAFAFPGKPKEGGGERIYFNPTDFPKNPDEALFHELVHAYRFGAVGYHGMRWTKMTEYLSAEEFIALHLQNIYRANMNHTEFYTSYDALARGKLNTKDHVYHYFSTNADSLML
jgi:hypothetical protein